MIPQKKKNLRTAKKLDLRSIEIPKELLDKVAGGGPAEAAEDMCPRCEKKGCLNVTYKQKMTNFGDLIDVRVIDCSNCWYHAEIPQYC